MKKDGNVEQNPNTVVSPYAKKSFRNFVITFILLFIQMLSLTFIVNMSISVVLLIPIIACFVLSILGLIYGIKSVRLKESSRWLKYIGLVGNLMLTSTLFTMLFYLLYSNFS